MKIVLATYGTRGDVEPGAALGLELMRRGHEVRMAVPPNLLGFAESAGLAPVAYGPDSRTAQEMDIGVNLSKEEHRAWRVSDLAKLWRENWELSTQCWSQMSQTLMSLADGADMLITGMIFEDGAANVAEYYGIPLVTLHYFPLRPNGQFLPYLPAPVGRATMATFWWLCSALLGSFERKHRRELGLPKDTGPSWRRVTERGALEIQAYDKVCFPNLPVEWAKRARQRPFVGTLTLALPTEADADVASWIAAGKPAICFNFGSMPMDSPADTLAMIEACSAELDQRALVCSAWTDFSSVPHGDHIKVVRTMNHAAIFPICRAVVHHGGAGTTAASLRAGVPTLILWATLERQLWGTLVKRLKVGTARRFSSLTRETLAADLRLILNPGYVDRAHELAGRMTTPAESVAATADLVECHARLRSVG
ncbi:glycosyl transferase family 1 [Mycobacterium sp. 1245111.1]|uniref:glycosyltransferase n=1 Tax=Mycobacterium sp. 1245111.1 TaxID=1834073 RepID=UPI0007FF0597|nr:glycosyltransferase [Mycobacterium sp. 1245111.1]OBK40973.1 glycosyl transferase family 1 [Mycobacterium sp. 1245111.1]